MNQTSDQHRKTCKKNYTRHKMIALCSALIICFSCSISHAETPELPAPIDGVSPKDVDWSLVEDEIDTESDMETDELSDSPMLALSEFSSDDVPEDYLTPAKHQGHVEKVYYITVGYTTDKTQGEETVKSVMVYFPAGYDESDQPYNVLYLLHGSNGSPLGYLSPDEPTKLQNLLDHMIEDGLMEPMIIIAATYYPADGSSRQLPLEKQVEVTTSFPRELVEDLIPQVEEQCRTYASSTSLEDIVASRNHRGIAGFSLGGVATWYVFLQQMQAFKWFLPISEASWDDGEGNTSGIFDSEVSARALYDAVMLQGYGWNDFMLFVATGTDDEAFDISTKQMISLLEYDEMFFLDENTFCSMMIDGTHTVSALYTYFYYILPFLFD